MSPSSRVLRAAIPAVLLAVLCVSAVPASAVPIGTAFTYQGHLNDGGLAPTGAYDLRFQLWNAASGGSQVGGSLAFDDLSVTSGVFSVELDFGATSLYFADALWLQVEVRPGASTGAYTVLARQHLTPGVWAIGLSLPWRQSGTIAEPLVQLLNSDAGDNSAAGDFSSQGKYGLIGRTTSNTWQAAGVRGEATGATGYNIGVEGASPTSPNGTGVVGKAFATGGFFAGSGPASTGVYATGLYRGVYAENLGVGPAIYAKGKGKTISDAVLRLENTETDRGMCAYFENNSNFATVHFLNRSTGQVLWLENQGTGDYIVATGPAGHKFWVDNAGTTHTKVLEILGGSDLSERFEVDGDEATIEPGTVVSIDPAYEGRLETSREPYDHRVAGIVSGAGGVKPGMLMGQRGSVADGEHPVALTGRVYCRATAANGPIRPGDLLTTSSVPGHAMRVTDPARAQGAILGKAMGTLERGEGLVLVLVGLQ